MKKVIIKLLNNFFTNLGYHLVKGKELQEQQIYKNFLESLLLQKRNEKPHNNLLNLEKPNVNFIVFSKDRALQLHALLSSLFANVTPTCKVFVLFRASNQDHAQAYNQVQEIYKNTGVYFYPEQHFKKDLISLVNRLTVSKLIFLVDDILFVEPVDLEDFIQTDTDQFVASLRMGTHLNFSYTVQQPQPLPPFYKPNLNKIKDKIVWKWQEGALDWHYPLSVDGHLFATEEIKAMLPLLNFKAPNSLEEAMQILKPYYLHKFGLAYQKAKIINIPCNKVQEENDNIAETVTVDYLLKKWQSGYQIDFAKFLHFQNYSAHQFIPFSFIQRTKY